MLNRNAFILFSCLIVGAQVNAQQSLHVFTGKVTEKSFNELYLYKSVNGKAERIAEYVTNPSNPQFAFAFPLDADANYKLAVQRMKPGHLHLDTDGFFNIPLKLDGPQQTISITPSQLDSTGQKGYSIERASSNKSLSFIKGHVINSNFGGMLSLERVVNGELNRITGSSVSKSSGEFFLALQVQSEGFYYLTTPGFRTRIYLKPQDELELNIDSRTGTYDLVNASKENLLLHQWFQLASPVTDYGYNRTIFTKDTIQFANYLKNYNALQPTILQFEEKNKTNNEKFNKLLSFAITLDNSYAPIYLAYCLSAKKTARGGFSKRIVDTTPDIQKFINSKALESAGIMQLGEAKNFMDLYCRYKVAYSSGGKKLSKTDELRLMMTAIPNDTLKGMFLKNKLGEVEVRNLSEFKSVFGPYAQDNFSPDVKEKYNQVYNQFAGDTVWIGKSSYDFSLPDSTGKIISMKNFKGKVVLIDVWATWCGPCRGEIPFLKQIEEDYKNNKDIAFVGISLDQAKDKKKWINFIQKESLGGVQLLDDFGKGFGRKYQIAGIPRFMLIDKKGNWIEVRCPVPSSSEDLKQYIDEALNKS